MPALALFEVVGAIVSLATRRRLSAWRGEAILLSMPGTGRDAAGAHCDEKNGDDQQLAICS
jgi:hypothetical protein